MKIKLGIAVLFSILLSGAYAQRPGGGNMPANGIITGTIQEYGTTNPMGYANVVLYSVKDSSIVSGSVTDMDGSFKLEKVKMGRHYLVANFIGFKKEYVNDIKITPKGLIVDLGVIELHSASEDLDAVEITAQKEHIEYQIDKRW